jgi:hypothetical protein
MSTYRRPVRRPERPRSGPNGCLVLLVVLVWVGLGALLLYQYFLRPQVSQQIGQQISQQLGTRPTLLPGQPSPGPGTAVVDQASGALPTLVAALPEGEIRVSEADANAYLAEHAAELQPIEAATLRFVPGEVQADIRALGTTSTARTGLAIQAGRIVTVDSRIEGPLENLVDLPGLIGPLQQQLNDELAAQGRRVTDVRIEQGVLVFMVES